MTMEEVKAKIREIGIIPVVRAANGDDACRAVDAICEGGISIIEVTMTVPDAPAVIREVIRHYGKKVVTGAGTVVTEEQAARCLDAGAEFLVSPGLSLPMLRAAQKRDVLAIPGALTPTELMTASEEGATLVKIFPCGNVGGPKYLKSLKAPFPNAALIPTGGVSVANAADYIAAGAFALGVGADLVDMSAIRKGDSQKVVNAAKELMAAVRSARSS
jgi:2-dehydro-3-deoxyphosphogluconate aldolase / (4S)-4-hydroxy-2-oxoglutarate aldolase